MVVDGLVRHFTRGLRHYDRDAAMARRGRFLPELVDFLLADPYLRGPPPTTAGREQFGAEYVQRIIRWGRAHHAKPDDLVRAASLLTALSIADTFHRWILPRARVTQLIVAGGGARNRSIMAQLGPLCGKLPSSLRILWEYLRTRRRPSRLPCWPMKR